MSSVRAAVVLVAVLVTAPALGEIPASMKAKRLAPADPAPAAIAVPEDPKLPVLGSCSVKGGACSSYEGTFAGREPKALCEKAKGTWSPAACPEEQSVGSCMQREGGSEDRIVTRSYPPTTADAARKACVSLPRGIFLKSK